MFKKKDKNENNAEPEDKRDIFEKCMGSMKFYQWVICMSLYLIKFPQAWHLISQGIMIPSSTPIYCVNTKIEIKDVLTSEDHNKLLAEACNKSCPQVIVSNKYYDNTIVHQYHLYCDRSYFTTTSQFLVMSGVFVGNSLFGIFPDKFGRKIPLVIACGSQAMFGIAIALSPNVYCYLVFKFLLNVFVGGSMISSFVLFSELIGHKWRSVMGILFHIPFALGHLSLVIFAYFINDWRWFQLSISLPSIFLISFYWYIPESPRWLLVVGQKEKAIQALEFVAKRNRMPTENIRQLVEEYEMSKAREGVVNKTGHVGYLFQNWQMTIITLGMWLNWFAVACCFYGISQYAGSIGVNVYINQAALALIQLPGTLFLFYTMYYWGRKWSMIFSNILCFFSLAVVIFIHNTYQIIPVTFAMFGLAMSFTGSYVYAGELFPTVIRNIGMGTSSSMARAGAMLAAVAADLKIHGDWVPVLIFVIFIGLASVGVFFLPETKNTKLPDTLEDVDNFRKKQNSEQ